MSALFFKGISVSAGDRDAVSEVVGNDAKRLNSCDCESERKPICSDCFDLCVSQRHGECRMQNVLSHFNPHTGRPLLLSPHSPHLLFMKTDD